MKDNLKISNVFGIGFSKTGTSSLSDALNFLGIKTIHYPYDKIIYSELSSGNFQLSVLNQYQAICDISVSPFYAQLDKIYPNSKFILTIRDDQQWLRSIKKHMELLKWWSTSDQEFKQFTQFICAAVYGCLEFSKDRFLFSYQLHLENVKEYFKDKPNNLLIMDIPSGDGWEKLAPFLGIDIPTELFPKKNKHDDLKEWIYKHDLAAKEIAEIVTYGQFCLIVEQDKLGVMLIKQNQTVPFFQNTGSPLNSDVAIRELKQLVAEGVSYIIFTWESFWWLDYYEDFYHYLNKRFPCILANDRLLIFKLHGRG